MVFAIAYLVICLLVFLFQRRLVFKNTKIPRGQRLDYSDYFEEVYFSPEEGVSLHGLFFPAAKSKGLVFFLHGTRGHMAKSGSVASLFLMRGYSVFMYDYRSYGKSDGIPTQENMYSDACWAFDYAQRHYPSERCIVYGHSLGTGLASYLSANRKMDAVILDAPYLSISDEAQRRYPYLPMKFILKFPFPSNVWLPKAQCPAYIIHGTDDQQIALDSAAKLAECAGCEYIVVPSGAHNNLTHFELHKQLLDRVLI